MAAKKTQNIKKPKSYLAMDIGGHSIKFALGIFQNGKLRVNALFVQPLPIGAYENGVIRDPIAVTEAIKLALKNHKIKEKNVVVTMESSDVIKREMTIPKVDPDDMLDLITYEVSQYLPIDINNYVLQYKVLREDNTGDQEKVHILLGAMPKEMAKAHFDILKSCGLTPLAMDLHTNVLSKLVSHLRANQSSGLNQSPIFTSLKQTDAEHETDDMLYEGPKKRLKTTAFIDFGYERIDINIMEGDLNRFNRILRMGVSGVDQIIAGHLEIDKSQVESKRLTFSEDSMIALKKAYEALKTLKSMHHLSDDDGIEINESDLTDENHQRVQAIQDSFDYLYVCLDEIDKVFKYYSSRSIDYRIDQIVLYGGATLNKDFARFVQERLDIPCYPFDASQFPSLQIRNAQDSPIKFVNALGALIRS